MPWAWGHPHLRKMCGALYQDNKLIPAQEKFGLACLVACLACLAEPFSWDQNQRPEWHKTRKQRFHFHLLVLTTTITVNALAHRGIRHTPQAVPEPFATASNHIKSSKMPTKSSRQHTQTQALMHRRTHMLTLSQEVGARASCAQARTTLLGTPEKRTFIMHADMDSE